MNCGWKTDFFSCDAELAPLHKAVSGQAIADEYIVLMKPDMIHEECTCLSIFAFVFFAL
jgi:hypothetical protein